MMDGALAGAPKLQFHAPDPATLRGTQGSGASGPGKMTYKYADFDAPKIGDPGYTGTKAKKAKKPATTDSSTPVATPQSKQP